jgi:hypothetical protein
MTRQFPYALETDQVHCYAEDGRTISCAQTGQDGAFQNRQLRSFENRFKIIDDVVRDNLTGAFWTRNANLAQFPLSWHEAQDFLADMCRRNAAGRNDWQLPPRRVLFALVSHQHINPVLPPNHPFDNVFPGYYWSADTCARLPDQAWYVHLGGGRIPRGMKHGAYMVWPVSLGQMKTSGGELPAKNRFEADDTRVLDTHTGLIWSRDADPIGRPLAWQEALEALGTINRREPGGHGTWRLPNIRELESLVDLKSHSPALADGHPFHNLRDGYWSATSSVYEPRYAWVLYGRDGMVGVGFKPGADFFLWPVRRG